MAVRFACSIASQLPAVFRRTEHFADRHLDDAHRHRMARLSAHAFRAAAGHRRFRRPGSRFLSRSLRRSLGGPLGSPSHSCGHSNIFHAAILRAGRAGSRSHHQHPRNYLAQPRARIDQRFRHAHAAILRRANGRTPRGLEQRHRLEFLHGQRRTADRPLHCRHRDRRLQRGLLLSSGRHQLHCGRPIAAGHAHRAHPARGSSQSRAARLARRMALRHPLRSHSLGLPFAGAVEPGGLCPTPR